MLAMLASAGLAGCAGLLTAWRAIRCLTWPCRLAWRQRRRAEEAARDPNLSQVELRGPGTSKPADNEFFKKLRGRGPTGPREVVLLVDGKAARASPGGRRQARCPRGKGWIIILRR